MHPLRPCALPLRDVLEAKSKSPILTDSLLHLFGTTTLDSKTPSSCKLFGELIDLCNTDETGSKSVKDCICDLTADDDEAIEKSASETPIHIEMSTPVSIPSRKRRAHAMSSTPSSNSDLSLSPKFKKKELHLNLDLFDQGNQSELWDRNGQADEENDVFQAFLRGEEGR